MWIPRKKDEVFMAIRMLIAVVRNWRVAEFDRPRAGLDSTLTSRYDCPYHPLSLRQAHLSALSFLRHRLVMNIAL